MLVAELDAHSKMSWNFSVSNIVLQLLRVELTLTSKMSAFEAGRKCMIVEIDTLTVCQYIGATASTISTTSMTIGVNLVLFVPGKFDMARISSVPG